MLSLRDFLADVSAAATCPVLSQADAGWLKHELHAANDFIELVIT
jgi:hypothetical protein